MSTAHTVTCADLLERLHRAQSIAARTYTFFVDNLNSVYNNTLAAEMERHTQCIELYSLPSDAQARDTEFRRFAEAVKRVNAARNRDTETILSTYVRSAADAQKTYDSHYMYLTSRIKSE